MIEISIFSNNYRYRLEFSTLEFYKDFLESDSYFEFVHDLYCSGLDIWCPFGTFENFDADEFRSWDSTETRHRHAVFHKQEVVWSNVTGRVSADDTICSKCGSKKVEYVGLGVGSSAVELICPKC